MSNGAVHVLTSKELVGLANRAGLLEAQLASVLWLGSSRRDSPYATAVATANERAKRLARILSALAREQKQDADAFAQLACPLQHSRRLVEAIVSSLAEATVLGPDRASYRPILRAVSIAVRLCLTLIPLEETSTRRVIFPPIGDSA